MACATREADDDVAPDPHGGDEPRLLVDDGADLGDEDLTAAGDFEPGQYAEQGCLPAARRPQERDELALGDSQVQVAEDLTAVERLGDLDRHGRRLGCGNVHRTAW